MYCVMEPKQEVEDGWYYGAFPFISCLAGRVLFYKKKKVVIGEGRRREWPDGKMGNYHDLCITFID